MGSGATATCTWRPQRGVAKAPCWVVGVPVMADRVRSISAKEAGVVGRGREVSARP